MPCFSCVEILRNLQTIKSTSSTMTRDVLLSWYSLILSGAICSLSMLSWRMVTQFCKESSMLQGCDIDATITTAVFGKRSSVRTYLSKFVWCGSPSRIHTPNRAWSAASELFEVPLYFIADRHFIVYSVLRVFT